MIARDRRTVALRASTGKRCDAKVVVQSFDAGDRDRPRIEQALAARHRGARRVAAVVVSVAGLRAPARVQIEGRWVKWRTGCVIARDDVVDAEVERLPRQI